MSNQNNVEKVVLYFINLLNIKAEDEFTIMDIRDDLGKVSNLNKFRKFAKNKISYEKYRFLTGYQKFIALVQDFEEENRPKLDYETEQKVYSYTTRLLSKLTSFSNGLRWEIEAKGYDVDKINLKATYLQALNEKDIEICDEVGYKQIFKLSKMNIRRLEERLEEAITQKALQSRFPQLVNKSKTEAIEALLIK